MSAEIAYQPWVVVAHGCEHHVIPTADLKPHAVQGCWCDPQDDDNDPCVVIHKSMDGREAFEDGLRKPS